MFIGLTGRGLKIPYKDPIKRAEYQANWYQAHKKERSEYMKKRYWRLKMADANFAAELHLLDQTVKEWKKKNDRSESGLD
jgi:DNA-binding transcriptional regulator YiaG